MPHGASWQDSILDEFTAGVSPVVVVADPDGLLQNEKVLAALRQRGFALLQFEDPIAFRYAYESQYRPILRETNFGGLLVRVAAPSTAVDDLPYDVLARAHRVSLGLAALFPRLDQAVLRTLAPDDWDALHLAESRATDVTALGGMATKDFVLRYVFGVQPELWSSPAALLAALLRRHYPGRRIPAVLNERIVKVLRDRFRDWPLERIVPDRAAFLSFLQERWPVFLDAQTDGGGVRERESLAFSGPGLLPFDHADVRVYMDNLFAEGLLRPVAHWRAKSLHKTWAGVGVRSAQQGDHPARLDRLFTIAADALPGSEASHERWFHFASVWAKVVALAHEPKRKPKTSQQREIDALRTRMDAVFADWLRSRYAGLANLPPTPPVMLHHVPRFLAREVGGAPKDAPTKKAALIVVDGLALDQWVAMRQELAEQRPGWRFHEQAVFAWVPTITSVSRQAVFAGTPPLLFPQSIHHTNKEEALWRRFWSNENIGQVGYLKGLGDGPYNDVAALVEAPGPCVVGLVVDKVDRIMHGMELGSAGMHNQVRQWTALGHFAALVDLLFSAGFRVYITSDHGNVEATGCGRPNEGATADLRGERVRVYSDESLRRGVAERFPEAWQWSADGLPEDYLPLLAPDRSAFVGEGERVVAHGGVCLEELVVPFVEVAGR